MKTAVKTIRCAVYTRKSSEENLQLDFNSLDAQRESGESYVASQKSEGWVCLPERYDDGGFTGGNMDRPAFQRLMADAQAGLIDCIVVYKIDRLSRSLLDFAKIMEVLERHNVSLVSVTQHFNTTSSMGRLTLNILLSFAQFEREIISERTRDKIAAAKRKGKWMGGPPVLGYDRVREPGGSKLVVNEEEAQRVRAIFQKYLETSSLLSTVKWINHRLWRNKSYQSYKGETKGGRAFDKSSLQYLLRNVVYVGKVLYKDQTFNGEHTAILSEDLFGRVQATLNLNRRSGGGERRNKYGALLKGLVRCKHCGCAMSHHFATRGNKRYRYYVCVKAQKNGWDACPSPSLPAGELENFVVSQIRSMGKDEGLLQDVLRRTQDRLRMEVNLATEQRKEARTRADQINQEAAELAPRAAVSMSAKAELEEVRERLREAEQEVTQINERLVRARRRMLDKDELTGAVEAFDPLWNSLSPKEQDRLIHLLVEQVEYDSDTETVAIALHPTGIRTLAMQEQN